MWNSIINKNDNKDSYNMLQMPFLFQINTSHALIIKSVYHYAFSYKFDLII